MNLDLSVKRGDAKLLRFTLGRDLTDASSVTLLLADRKTGGALLITRTGNVEDAGTGVVTFQLAADDYGTGKLLAGKVYRGEVECQPGPLTHPDDAQNPYINLTVLADLNPPT
jgi:hypothetical protein